MLVEFIAEIIAEDLAEIITEIIAKNTKDMDDIITGISEQHSWNYSEHISWFGPNFKFLCLRRNLNIGPNVANRIRIIMATRGASDRNLSFYFCTKT